MGSGQGWKEMELVLPSLQHLLFMVLQGGGQAHSTVCCKEGTVWGEVFCASSCAVSLGWGRDVGDPGCAPSLPPLHPGWSCARSQGGKHHQWSQTLCKTPLEAEILYEHIEIYITVEVGEFKANISPLCCSLQLFL